MLKADPSSPSKYHIVGGGAKTDMGPNYAWGWGGEGFSLDAEKNSLMA